MKTGKKACHEEWREKATKTGRGVCPEKWTRFYIWEALMP